MGLVVTVASWLAVQENLSLQKQKISDETVSRLSMQKANK